LVAAEGTGDAVCDTYRDEEGVPVGFGVRVPIAAFILIRRRCLDDKRRGGGRTTGGRQFPLGLGFLEQDITKVDGVFGLFPRVVLTMKVIILTRVAELTVALTEPRVLMAIGATTARCAATGSVVTPIIRVVCTRSIGLPWFLSPGGWLTRFARFAERLLLVVGELLRNLRDDLVVLGLRLVFHTVDLNALLISDSHEHLVGLSRVSR
jgi:hypothetical protein